MTDPFDALALPLTPVTPAPRFAADLRARLTRALDLPRGVTMTETTPGAALAEPTATLGAAIPYLAVRDAPRAIRWYVEVFAARLVGEPIVMPDGRIGHCELALAGGLLYLSEEHPELGVVAPDPAATAVSLMLAVPDVDATRAAALAQGAAADGPAYDAHGARNAWIRDPFGHRWGLNTPTPTPVALRRGDLAYASVCVPDIDRAMVFYADVLGWDVGPGRQHVATTPAQGLEGGHDSPTVFCCFAVPDLEAAIADVRDAGGEAGDPHPQAGSRVVDCHDDQGTAFALYESPDVADGAAPPANGTDPGDIGYLTLRTPDSGRARAFYGAVLGWTFSPGNADDGWNVDGPAPMTGLAGGAPLGTAVPMWRVADLESAIERVRSGGGASTDPQRQPYGLLAECSDDQGTAFYLGEL